MVRAPAVTVRINIISHYNTAMKQKKLYSLGLRHGIGTDRQLTTGSTVHDCRVMVYGIRSTDTTNRRSCINTEIPHVQED